MLTGSLGTAIRYDQSGDDMAPLGSLAVWTGTGANGNAFQQVQNEPKYFLGYPVVDAAVVGNGGDKNNWLAAAVLPWEASAIGGTGLPGLPGNNDLINRSIYVMSGEITVVPEPSTILLWVGMAGIAGVVFWRKRRS
jgi:hypothetical protein